MKYYVVDVFTDTLFSGNPAGVCLLDDWPEDSLLQNIAFENNLAETAFAVKKEGYYALRWFTPQVEVDLCGHATLASAYVLLQQAGKTPRQVEFRTKSGALTVRKDGDLFMMDFPSRKPVSCPAPAVLEKALGARVLETHKARDLLVLVEDRDTVASLQPDFPLLKSIKGVLGIIVTAKGDQCDFVSRFFAPGVGIDEDPVTGSSHSTLIPFWKERLQKTDMMARQLSRRGGSLICKDRGERVLIGGKARLYLKGDILL